MPAHVLENEVHVYYASGRPQRVVYHTDGQEIEIPLVAGVKREMRFDEIPTVEIRVYGRLVEHEATLEDEEPAC